MKRCHSVGVSQQSEWAEFSSYQVRRLFVPRRRLVDGQSVGRESDEIPEEESEGPRFPRSHIKMSKSMNAITESEHIDHNAMRRQRFLVHNIHGHMSDSSIQRLLYGVGDASVHDTDVGVKTGTKPAPEFLNKIHVRLTENVGSMT